MPETTAVHLSVAARQVAEALTVAEQHTVRALADRAGVSKSTVAKTLALLERSDAAIRTVREDDGIREADLWSPGPALGALLFTADAGTPGDSHVEALATATQTALGLQPSSTAAEADVTERSDVSAAVALELVPSEAVAEYLTLPSSSAVQCGLSNVESNHAPAAVLPADSAFTETVMNALSTSAESAPGARVRLAAGELAAMVAAVLATHPDIEYTPAMLSNLLGGRSSGAIHNVLVKMVEAGTAVRTCDKPKRYRLTIPQASNGS